MSVLERIRSFLKTKLGYLIILLQEMPGIGFWTGFMSLPFFVYILFFIKGLPANLILVVEGFLFTRYFVLERILIITGILLFCYSLYHMRHEHKKYKVDLVTTGPYKFVRHPQYLGILILTLGLTSWSYFYATMTRGITYWAAIFGVFVNPTWIWYLELFLYIIIALIEESYLLKKFGEKYEEYRKTTPFFVPFIKLESKVFLEIVFTIIFFAGVLNVLIYLQYYLLP